MYIFVIIKDVLPGIRKFRILVIFIVTTDKFTAGKKIGGRRL